MPTYEYKCDECGNEFEEFQSITAKPIRKCPECGKNRVKRLIGRGAGLIFRGSGFYETDYRSDSYSEGAKADKESTSPKSDTKASSSDSGSSKTTEPTGKSTSTEKSSD